MPQATTPAAGISIMPRSRRPMRIQKSSRNAAASVHRRMLRTIEPAPPRRTMERRILSRPKPE